MTQGEARKPGPKLFEPLQIGSLMLTNRIVVAPMCQHEGVRNRLGRGRLRH